MNDPIYERNGKKYTHTQLKEKYGNNLDAAIEKFGFKLSNSEPQENTERLQPVTEYEYNGKKFSREQLEQKYGPNTDKAISELGFKDVSPRQEVDETLGAPAQEVDDVPVPEIPSKKKADSDSYGKTTPLDSNGNTQEQPGSSESGKNKAAEKLNNVITSTDHTVITQNFDGQVENTQDQTPEFWDSIKNSGTNVWNSIQGAVPRLNVVSADVWEGILGKELADKFYDATNPESLEESRNEAYAKLDELEKQVKPTRGLVEAGEKGDAAGLVAGAADAVAQLASTAAVSIPTFGAGLFTEMTGSSIVDYNTTKADRLGVSVEKLYESQQAELGVPLAVGIAGGALERVGFKGVTSAINRGIQRKGLKEIALVFNSSNKEGLTEYFQTAMETGNKSIAAGKNSDQVAEDVWNTMSSKEGLESYLMGAVGSGITVGGARGIKMLKTPPEAQQKIRDNQSQISKLKADLNNPNVPDAVKTQVQNKINSLQEENRFAVKREVEEVSKMPEKEVLDVLDIEKEQAKVAREAKEMMNSSNLSEDALQIMYGEKEKQWDDLEARKKEILENKPNEVQAENIQEDQIETQPEPEVEEQVTPEEAQPELKSRDELISEVLDKVGKEQLGEWYIEDNPDTEVDANGNLKASFTRSDIAKYAERAGVSTEKETVTNIPDNSDNNITEEAMVTDESLNEPVQENPTFTEPEQQENMNTTPEPKQIKIADGSPEYTVEKTDAGLTIKDPKGNEPSKPTKRKILDKYSEDIDFTQGEVAPPPQDNSVESTQYIAENSNNPAEIADALVNTDLEQLTKDNISYEERIISENIGFISSKSFNRFGDRNMRNQSIGKSYLRADGAPIDTFIEELNEDFGTNLTEQDIIDFIVDNPNGPADLSRKVKNEKLVPLQERFTKLTGLPANDKFLQKALDQARTAEIRKEYETSLDYMSDEELLSLAEEINQSETQNYGEETTNTGATGSTQTQNRPQDGTGPSVRQEGNEQVGTETEGNQETINPDQDNRTNPNYIARGVGMGNNLDPNKTQGFYAFDKEAAINYAEGNTENVMDGFIPADAKVLRLVENHLQEEYDFNDNAINEFTEILGEENVDSQDASDITEVLWGENENVQKLRDAGYDVVIGNTMDGAAAYVLTDKGFKRRESESEVEVEQASTQARSNSLITERIKPEKRPVKSEPKKLNEIIAKVSKDLKSTLIYGRSGRARTLGTYSPRNTLVRISRAGDLDTVAHELGHFLDDRFNVIGTIPSDMELQTTRQLKWFSDRGGSNPPKRLSKEQKRDYLQREGLAEFIRAYVVNPTQAKTIAPELYEHFKNSVSEKTITALNEFSGNYLDIANASAGERIGANIEGSDLIDDKEGFRAWLDKFKGEDGQLNITPWDRINSHLFNSMGIAEKAFSFLTDVAGKKNLKPSQDFEVMSRVFAGINGKLHRVLTSGLINAKNEQITDSKGDTMNVKWLLDPLENTSEKTVTQEMNEVIALLVAERTMEYAKKFERLDNLTGVGAGISQDIEVAQEHINDFNDLKNTNREKYDRIKEAGRRYREFADAGLKYAVGKGRLSKADYDFIKENNEYYAALTRIQEDAPTEESLGFVNEMGGSISSSREIIQRAKGGTGFIQNPYVSLLQNTVGIMKESDRNEVMQSFIEPLTKIRKMGDGSPVNFAQIARPAQTGDKNTRTVYVDGQRQSWQFAPDIYKALASLEGVAKNPIVDLMAVPASVIRFTVTRFPTFALRNATRDTFSRMIVSRTNSGFKDLIQNSNDKALFEMYGGSQAGFYLTNKKSYKQTLRQAVQEITNSGGIVLDPRNLGKKYFEALERGENLNRIAEFKSAYRKAKKKGLSEYDAGIYAAYQARDLMDFAVAGHTVRTLNKMIPFLNAGIQGLRRTGKAAKENPTGFAIRTALYTVLPQIIFRTLVTLQGDDEEYEQLPAYQRDLFWNFKTPFTGDSWITIPKPFEQGLISSTIDRGISKIRGNDQAFSGFSGTVSNSLMPFDETSTLGGMKPIIEASVNHNMFTERPIVPQWEEGKLMELRKGKEKASRAGKFLARGFEKAGMSVDPRKVDHVIQGYGTYMANWGLSLSDLGVEDSRYKFNISKTGFARDVPMSNSVSVSSVYKLATELGRWNDKRLSDLRGDIEKFYDSDDAKERKQLTKQIYAKAEKLRKEFEAKKKEVKTDKPKEEEKPKPAQAIF